jgi:glycosyltransferase involved in cell wall biosynthesis
MKLSVLVATKDRADALAPCLDSIAAAFARAAPLDAEIVIVDNGSTDTTADVIRAWIGRNDAISVKSLIEPVPGKARALNRALRAAAGEVLAFTDDDCRLHPEYINDLLRHDSADTEPVLRGGRIELGDAQDLPFTINTDLTRKRWSRALNSAKSDYIVGRINGCNLVMRRTLVERLGPFDENFGVGSRIGSGDDADFIFRTYVAGVPIEYVPDMTVYHHHGRRTVEAARALWRKYTIGSGGLYAKYMFVHPYLCRVLFCDIVRAAREIRTGSNDFLPEIGFSHKHRVAYSLRGAARYIFMSKAQRPALGKTSPGILLKLRSVILSSGVAAAFSLRDILEGFL